MKKKVSIFIVLSVVAAPVYAHGQSWQAMIVFFGLLLALFVTFIAIVIFVVKKIKAIKRKGHIYAYLLVEGKKIEVKADTINKKFFDDWAARMGYKNYEIIYEGEVVDVNNIITPEMGQVFEIVNKFA